MSLLMMFRPTSRMMDSSKGSYPLTKKQLEELKKKLKTPSKWAIKNEPVIEEVAPEPITPKKAKTIAKATVRALSKAIYQQPDADKLRYEILNFRFQVDELLARLQEAEQERLKELIGKSIEQQRLRQALDLLVKRLKQDSEDEDLLLLIHEI